ncbi:MAG: S41 family peptidase [Peptoniphilaceae bacterium]|nr:S41 family peptidase [Peptoniphilaceae bacterium]MDY6018099.1 S41 family peptidase [Anaerococcus sp.]
MKKLGKVLLAFALCLGIGFVGYTLGKNTGTESFSFSQKDQDHMREMDAMKDLIKENYLFDYKENDLYEGSLKGMFANLGDPYTQFYTKKEFDNLMESVNGKYAGIGVVVQASKEGLIKAVQIFDNSPAKEAGIKVGDYISKVNGKEYSALQMEEAVAEIKGKVGTEVELTILRPKENDKPEEKTIKLKRADVTVQTVESKIVEADNHKIGYLKLKQFEDVSYDEFVKHFKDLKDKNAEGLIIDLRNNPGGALDVCLKISDIFLDEGVIVSTIDKKGKEIVEESDKQKDDIPLVVLVNENSASASEIMAGALKDRQRATIVGTSTFGKGIVQKIFPLEDGSGAKITVSEYFTPNKNKINKIGVKPDRVINNNLNAQTVELTNTSKDLQYVGALEAMIEKLEK